MAELLFSKKNKQFDMLGPNGIKMLNIHDSCKYLQ